MDLLEAVIGLGPNLFYGTGLAACILVFRQRKPKDRRKKVLIVDASTRVQDAAARRTNCCPSTSSASTAGIATIKDVEGVARVVTLDEIAANDYNLNIPRYVEPTDRRRRSLTVDEAMQRLKDSARRGVRGRRPARSQLLEREGLLQ